jgi:hypothetical protein
MKATATTQRPWRLFSLELQTGDRVTQTASLRRTRPAVSEAAHDHRRRPPTVRPQR